MYVSALRREWSAFVLGLVKVISHHRGRPFFFLPTLTRSQQDKRINTAAAEQFRCRNVGDALVLFGRKPDLICCFVEFSRG